MRQTHISEIMYNKKTQKAKSETMYNRQKKLNTVFLFYKSVQTASNKGYLMQTRLKSE